jgi:hypothetical protein
LSFLCIRIDLDYVPWDTPDAQQFGHGEPAMLLRLLELGRQTGSRWHFFASERALRAFPTGTDAVLNDGHDLDYLAKHPEDTERAAEAGRLMSAAGHSIRGWAIRGGWPASFAPPGVEFLSGPADSVTPLRLFPTEGRGLHETVRQGGSLRTWLSETIERLHGEVTVVVTPQVMARVDPKLDGLKELLRASREAEMPLRTLREATGA